MAEYDDILAMLIKRIFLMTADAIALEEYLVQHHGLDRDALGAAQRQTRAELAVEALEGATTAALLDMLRKLPTSGQVH